MLLTRRQLMSSTGAMPVLAYSGAQAQSGGAAPTIKICVMSDQSGPYSSTSGPVSVACVRQAVEDFNPPSRGFNVEILTGDHQNRADIGVNLTRQWFDRDGADVVMDVSNSAVALAVQNVAREKDKIHLNSAAATADLTGKACTPNGVHWTYDSWMLAASTGGALVRSGGDSWFFIVANFAFGHALERDTGDAVRRAGGKVLGRVAHPAPGTSDFSSFLLQAQASRAKVIGLANGGDDTVNVIKQAAEFGITRSGQKLAALLMFVSDVHAIGLPTAQGLLLTESFYWDLNDRTRAFTRRVLPKTGGIHPNMNQAGCYSAAMHYLKAVADMGPAAAKQSGATTVARMKSLPTDDDAFGAGGIRPDGRKLHDVHLFRVKSPEASRGAWDYYELLSTTPADKAFRPLQEGGCSLIHT
ncbi:ABC transporter substrate-binding protein [Dankookia rubra]|uniref:ABC transporter substrate-binding protein n=1 Tax=Dankookia rubra TaxID=1442381 RepID=A0A4R5Q8Y3_9PROT|nr:ABC transporter substrate-binding protein [Dankookia rubra]TDH58587.1 ABC transporter substrate-binding protein [Dankookia rubra]